MKVDISAISIPSAYIGFVYIDKSIVDVFQLKFWSDEDVSICECSVCSGVERQRERSETRR